MNAPWEDPPVEILSLLGLSGPQEMAIEALAGGGSDRSFYRLRGRGGSILFVRYLRERQENGYYAAIGDFLRDIGVPVPRMIRHDPEQGLLWMEDLGDTDLWSCRAASWAVRRPLYEQCLEMIGRLHAFPVERFPWGTVPLMKGFDHDLYRWEREYFRENFVERICGVRLAQMEALALEEELTALALRLAMEPQVLVHRDFQSRNIMIRGGEVFLIDFQGLRLGNPFYDLASLLYDPYVTMADSERTTLLAHAHRCSGRGREGGDFRKRFEDAAAQRLMQALGAYGFLGIVKGRREFLDFLDTALSRLEEVAGRSGDLPRLHALAIRCCGPEGKISPTAHLDREDSPEVQDPSDPSRGVP